VVGCGKERKKRKEVNLMERILEVRPVMAGLRCDGCVAAEARHRYETDVRVLLLCDGCADRLEAGRLLTGRFGLIEVEPAEGD